MAKAIAKLVIDKCNTAYVTLSTELAKASAEHLEHILMHGESPFIKLDDGRYLARRRIDEFTIVEES